MARQSAIQPGLFAPSEASTKEAAREVLQAWAKHQEERGSAVKQTDTRLEIIVKVMEAGRYQASQLLAYLQWVFTAPAKWPAFMRKPEHPYLEVENLFRRCHLQEHLQEAETWVAGQEEDAPMVAIYGGRAYSG